MQEFLILKLQGAMQAWGKHTYEDYRPSHIFPTRSAIVGLLCACLGIDRKDSKGQENLNNSIELTVITNQRIVNGKKLKLQKITDYHTVLDARNAKGGKRKDAIVSSREYLCDAEFTVILHMINDAVFNAEVIKEALKKPHYTPFLGRRSCPIHRPLFEKIEQSENIQQLLNKIKIKEIIYSEAELKNSLEIEMRIRDVPITTKIRQFTTRYVYILGADNVS